MLAGFMLYITLLFLETATGQFEEFNNNIIALS